MSRQVNIDGRDERMSCMASTVTDATVLCCLCGCGIAPNPSNTCVDCLRTQVDITVGIPKSGVIHYCRSCGR